MPKNEPVIAMTRISAITVIGFHLRLSRATMPNNNPSSSKPGMISSKIVWTTISAPPPIGTTSGICTETICATSAPTIIKPMMHADWVIMPMMPEWKASVITLVPKP